MAKGPREKGHEKGQNTRQDFLPGLFQVLSTIRPPTCSSTSAVSAREVLSTAEEEVRAVNPTGRVSTQPEGTHLRVIRSWPA